MSDKQTPATLHAVVRGRVQGVGFRFFVLRQAEARGLSGWVRNLPDGSVELQAVGDRPALEALLSELQRGPAVAHVDSVEHDWTAEASGGAGFKVVG
jgi:acylphosphatase